MGKRRITLVVDDEDWNPGWRKIAGFTIESVEDIPEPNRVQEFRVRVETKPHHDPVTRGVVNAALCYSDCYISNEVTVTEVDVTP